MQKDCVFLVGKTLRRYIMTREEVFEFYKMLHSRIIHYGGTDWFVDRAGKICSIAEVIKEKILEYSYYIRPRFSSPAGPVNPNHDRSAEDYASKDE